MKELLHHCIRRIASCWKNPMNDSIARRAFRFLRVGATGLALALAFASGKAAKADSPVDIYENDGLPTYFGTRARWDITVRNNSDVEPPAYPYNEGIRQVFLYDLFSTQQPTLASLVDGWTGSVSPGIGPNLWNIYLGTQDPFSYIAPGDIGGFGINTYRPASLPTIVVGVRYGQARLETWGLQPPSPGADFLGPVGLAPLPGDMNHDYLLDLSDLPGFLAVLLGQDADPAHIALADLDCSGAADGRDIQLFVEALL